MLKRGIVLGSLIAGAFLLPVAAGAGVVSGVCSGCHTMHASIGGVASAANGTLLSAGANCYGCHADPGVENGNTGRGTVAPFAPQVDGTDALTAGYINNGGYFNAAAGNDAHQHNVAGISLVDAALGNTPPGGALMGAQLSCANCHGGSGIHHGSASTSYRALSNTAAPTVTTTLGTQPATPAVGAYGAVQDNVAGVAAGNRGQLAYNSTTMNLFCANCHATFHGAANQDGATLNDGTWIRHPTGVSTTTAGVAGPSIVARTSATDSNAVPVGTTGVAADEVMCVSCHVPHGGPFNDLLSFDYSTNVAGGGVASPGCESCHSYAGGGM